MTHDEPTNRPSAIRTQRLLIRSWQDSDAEPFAVMNADPEVRRHFPSCLTRPQSDAQMKRLAGHIITHGWGFWALELPGIAPFIGFCGIETVRFSAPFTPAVEIGWRLARPYWGHGYAQEAAQATLTFGFGTLGLDEIVAFTIPANVRSWRLMERLGMTRDPTDDFEHPNVAEGHPMRLHVLYRKKAQP